MTPLSPHDGQAHAISSVAGSRRATRVPAHRCRPGRRRQGTLVSPFRPVAVTHITIDAGYRASSIAAGGGDAGRPPSERRRSSDRGKFGIGSMAPRRLRPFERDSVFIDDETECTPLALLVQELEQGAREVQGNHAREAQRLAAAESDAKGREVRGARDCR